MRFPRLATFVQHQLRRAFGMLFPQLGDLPIRFAECGNGGAPVTENGLKLSLRTFFARDRKNLANACGQRVGDGVWRSRDRKPQPSQTVLLVVVVVPPAVFLTEVKRQNRA